MKLVVLVLLYLANSLSEPIKGSINEDQFIEYQFIEDQLNEDQLMNKTPEEIIVDKMTRTSFCDKVLPTKHGYVTKFSGRNLNPSINSTMELYLKEGHIAGGLTGIFKNIDQICFQSDDYCLPGLINTEYVENNVLNIRCAENNWYDLINEAYRYSRMGPLDTDYLYAARKIYMWLPFGYQKELMNQIQTGVNGKPITVNVNSRYPNCKYIFTAKLASWTTPKDELNDKDLVKAEETKTEATPVSSDPTPVVFGTTLSTLEVFPVTTDTLSDPSIVSTVKATEGKREVYVVDGYSNHSLCDYLFLGAPYTHRIKMLLNKEDLTLKKWKSELDSIGDDYFSSTELEFEDFLPLKESNKLFEDRRLPEFLEVATTNICTFFQFKQGMDTKMKVLLNIWNTDLEMDLLLRAIPHTCSFILAKILPPSASVQRKITDHHLHLFELINKPVVLSFSNKGTLLFEFLGGKRLEYFLKFNDRHLFTESVRLDFDGIQKVLSIFDKRAKESEDPPVFSYTDDNFVAPVSNLRHKFRAYHHLQCVEGTPTCKIVMNVTAEQDTYAGIERYDLMVVNEIGRSSKELISFSSAFELVEPFKLGKRVRKMNLTVSFVDFVERNKELEAFKLFDEVIDDKWFSNEFSPYDLPVFM